ncbi:Peroxisomal targeting signal 2 receptor, partial [Phytophthora megakarya]
IAAHGNEVLALDWNKYNQFEVVSGSADCTIKVWDIRNPACEVRMLPGHNYAVKKIKCSPHDPDVIASASYDMSVGVWNIKSPYPRLQNAQHHSEFVFGFDFSLFVDGLVASCSWDRHVADMETPKKSGIWTQHVDPNSGRTYYFNMALGRSYWELPEELQAQVKKPTLDALREWDPETAERKYGAASEQSGENEEIRRKREEALAKSRTEVAGAQATSTKLSLDERMALAAQKKMAEVQSNANRPASTESSNEYLQLVRQLQQNDDSEGGGKWLVR